jgi:N,N'-diacetyllegionaminate synthase
MRSSLNDRVRQIAIGNTFIGDDSPTFIIAETASNHMGHLATAFNMIDAAINAQASAVKFQIFSTEDYITPSHPRFELSRQIEFTPEDWVQISEYANRKGIIFIADVLDDHSATLAESLKIDALKIHSTDMTNQYHLQMVAGMNKPVFLATGTLTLGEVEYAVNLMGAKGNTDVVIMHGYSNYPTPIDEQNLLVIPALKKIFQLPVGFLDHTIDIYSIPSMAVALGANVLEKHITLDRNMKGYDWEVSLEPAEFREMTRNLREMEKALGSSLKRPSESEVHWRDVLMKKIVAREEISEGEVITSEKIAFKRAAGEGLLPNYAEMLCGRKAGTSISKDELITWAKIQQVDIQRS